MHRIILLLLGVTSAVWILRDLDSPDSPTAGGATFANTAADPQPTSECQSFSPVAVVAVSPTEVLPQPQSIDSEEAEVVRAAKYSVLVQDTGSAAADNMPELTSPPANISADDRAALGRWATRILGSLVERPAAAATSASTGVLEKQHPLGAFAARPENQPPTSVAGHDPSITGRTAPTSDMPKVFVAYETSGGTRKIVAATSLGPSDRPVYMERPPVISAVPESAAAADGNSLAAAMAAKLQSTASPAAAQASRSSTAQAAVSSATATTSQTHTSGAAAAAMVPAVPVREPLTPELEALSRQVQYALAMYQHQRLLNTATNAPWEVMHRFVAFGAATEVLRDGPGGEPVNAIGWLLWGGRCKSQPVLVLSGDRPLAMVGVGVQGHPGQFLAMLAQSRVRPESPFALQGQRFTVRDLIEEEKLDCDSSIELTFELIAMSYYLKTDDVWTSRNGEEWSISRLVHEEIRQPIHTAACGGSHRLFGLSAAFKKRICEGKPVNGEFLSAQKYIRAYQNYTLSTLQNRDGSFSTDWFKRSADNGDLDRKMQTTGHMLEWLVFSLDDSQLRDPHVIRAVDFLATQTIMHPNRAWSIGPLGHALHALTIYQARVLTPGGPLFLQPSAVPVAPSSPAKIQPYGPPETARRTKPLETNSTLSPLPPLKPIAKPQSQQALMPAQPKADPVHLSERPPARPALRQSVGTPNSATATAEVQGPDLGLTR